MIVSFDEFIKQAGGTPSQVKPVAPPIQTQQKQSVLSQLNSKLKERESNVKTAITQGVEAGQSPKNLQEFASRATKMINAGASIPGQAIGAIGDVIGAGLEKTGVTQAVAPIVSPIVNSDAVTKLTEAYRSLPKETQDLLGNLTNIASIVPVVKGTEMAANTTKNVVKDVVTGVNTAVDASKPTVEAIMNTTKGVTDGISRIPSRVATNIAEKQATEDAIKALPTKVAQNAVRDGVDIVDVKDISSIPRTPQVKKLIETVKSMAKGNKDVDPIEVVGEPMIQRVKTLEKDRTQIGKELQEVSKNLGIVTKPELQTGVFTRIQSVPGLEGVKVSPTGKLDFSNTSISSNLAESKTARNNIQKAYTKATKWGDGEKAHLFRQELFEILGGKTKSLSTMTATEEKGLDAIRKGLSDVLDTKNDKYKALNTEYAQVMEPLGELRKLMKNIDPTSTDDILNMSAGLLARRITSAAPSNPRIRQLLQSLDTVGRTKGSTSGSVTQLQDMYNLLNKYYDIAPKTGFQNLVKEGVGASDSITGMAKETIKNIAGKSNAVRQKALEALLDELKTI